ncbi:NAD-dependent epimerase/dehydratase family protein [Vibrio parahaemolyticus]|nr:NAD-dependent epimerase/dehydratase family protein [Vibrio parahaemolyticus]
MSQKSWGSLRNKTVLVTGATGMLAACMVRFFVYLNRKDQLNIRVLLLARSEQKVQDLFGELTGEFECFYQDVCQPIEFDDEVDFVIHAASNASPYHIKHDPVGIIQANVVGTMNLLELVKNKRVKTFCSCPLVKCMET